MESLPKKFRLAIKAAKFSERKRYQLSAVLFVNKKPCSIGYNDFVKSHPLMGNQNSLKRLHAEMNAVSGLKHNWDMKDAFLVVCRVKKDGSLGMSRPCIYCREVLKNKGINTIYYTTEDGYAKEFL